MTKHLQFIDGKFTAGSATENIDVINPATEEVIGSVRRGGARDAEAAVAAASAAFRVWKRTPANPCKGGICVSGW